MIQLLTRGDDAGNSRSANRAIRQCCEKGLLRNVSVMACGDEFEDAVRVLDGLKNVDFGLHICLSSEWDAPRWSSVLPREQVPTLLDDEQMFTRAPNVLHARGFSVDEAMREIEAQLRKVRASGLRVSYLDEHMGVSWISPALRSGIAQLAHREGLIDVDAHGLEGLSGFDSTQNDSAAHLIERLSQELAASSTRSEPRLIVTHPMCDDEEARGFHGLGQSGEQIARSRENDRKMWCDARLVAWSRAHDIEPKRFSDVLK